MAAFLDLWASSPVVLDGGWATELQARGLRFGEPADAWNLARPDEVEAVARAYVDAGARAILTNTFQANPPALARNGLEGEARRLNTAGARIARRAVAGTAVRVVGSIGPIGDQARANAADAFALQCEALAEGGVDALVLETFSDPYQARLAVRAGRAVGLPVVASFYFDLSSGGPKTLTGASPEAVARAMVEEGAAAVGANCGAGVAEFPAVCARLKRACDLPVWIKPNAGLPTIHDGKAVYGITPEVFASFLPALVEAGAAFVGGCCGTSPAFIRALRSAVDSGPAPPHREAPQR